MATATFRPSACRIFANVVDDGEPELERASSALGALIWTFVFVVGISHLAHCIGGSAEVLSAAAVGRLGADDYLGWLGAATLGNVGGGITIVAILNHAQVVAGNEKPV